MEALQKILEQMNVSGTTFDTIEEYERFKVDSFNRAEGHLHEEDGYCCNICKNKGSIMKLVEEPGKYPVQVVAECKCAEVRRSIRRMKKSGLKDIIKDYTFDKYEAADPWQQAIKSAAEEYAKNPEGWFFLGGQSGAGKTHLCTAICREFLLNGRRVVYMLWRDDIAKLKALSMETEQRMRMIDRFKKAEVLYIDDLFKTGKNPDNSRQHPTSADINVAFEIINYRYINPGLLTIISSECTQDELLDIDEASGGRIFEKAGAHGFSIAPDRSRNYRTRKTMTV